MLEAQQKKSSIVIGIWIVFFCIQDTVQYFVSVLRYVDELLALFILVLLFLEIVRTDGSLQFQLNTLVIAGLLCCFLLVGALSTLLNGVQPISNVMMDVLVWIKFVCVIGVGFMLMCRRDHTRQYQRLVHVLDALIVFYLLLFLFDATFQVFSSEVRLGLRSVKLFYGAYTTMSAVLCFLSAIYLRLYEFLKERILLRLIPLWGLMISTLRFKAICAVFLMIFVYIIVCKHRRVIGVVRWAVIGCGGLLIGLRGILYYFVTLSDESARAALLQTSLAIMKDYFPLGTGFATFGSAFSVDPYSRIYELYHINHIWGISESYHAFISDSFWPYLLGEMGILGAVFYVGLLIAIFWRISRLKRMNAYAYASALVCFLYLMISSTGESAFANTFAVYFGFWIGVILAEEVQTNEIMEHPQREAPTSI